MIAERLKHVRLRAGFKSQKEFAAAIGVSVGLVGQWETGLKVPGRSNLAKIGERCLVSMAYLLGETDDPFFAAPITDPMEIDMLRKFRELKRVNPAYANALENFVISVVLGDAIW